MNYQEDRKKIKGKGRCKKRKMVEESKIVKMGNMDNG